MARIKKTNIKILSMVSVVIFLVNENAFEVDCGPQFDKENSLQNPENLSGLVFQEGNYQITIFHLNDKNFTKLEPSSLPEDPVFSCKRKTLYWIETLKEINAYEPLQSEPTRLISDTRNSIIPSIALDFITDKLYLADMHLSTIEVVDLKNGNRGIVKSAKLPGQIQTIAIDPNEGYLFVLSKTQLVRIDLDGMNERYIFQGLPISKRRKLPLKKVYIVCMALNLIEKRIYWMHVAHGTISSSTYDGTDRKLHLKLGSNQDTEDGFNSRNMAFFSHTLYWIDNNHGVIRRTNLSNANESEVIYKSTPGKKMYYINSVNCNSTDQHHKRRNPCDQDNGGCQHLCILSRSSDSKYRCFCNVGYELAKDGKSCILPTKFIVFGQDKFIRGIGWREDIKQYIDVLNPTEGIFAPWSHLDVNTKEGAILYQSRYDPVVSVDVHNTKTTTLKPDFLASITANLAFDWASRNLYYLSDYYTHETILCVMNIENATYSKVLIRSESLGSILMVHPNRGFVYFDLEGSKLNRVHTDGSNQTLVFERKFNTTTIDYDEDDLYWVEIKNGDYIVYKSDLAGKNITEVKVLFLHSPFEMTIQGDWMYFTNNKGQSIDRVSKKGGELEQLITSNNMMRIRIFDPSIQPIRSDHPCAISSENDCEKFCFAVPTTQNGEILKHVCGCPYGEKLADDKRSCVDNSKEEPPFVACKSLSRFRHCTIHPDPEPPIEIPSVNEPNEHISQRLFNTENLLQNSANQSDVNFTQENREITYNPNDEDLINLITRSPLKDLVFSCNRKTLYWTENNIKIKAREDFETQSISVVFEDRSERLSSIALDSITNKLYIGNRLLHIITVLDLKTGNHGIIRSGNLSGVEEITIDPYEGYLFVIGDTELIRMDLDGLNDHIILQGSIRYTSKTLLGRWKLYIKYIGLDLIEKRVYWMNGTDNAVSSSTYDGTDQKLHNFEFNLNYEMPARIVFLSNNSYWINNNHGVITKINLSNSNDTEEIDEDTAKKLFFMNTVNCNSTNQRQVTNPCEKENGGCEHMCILSRSSKTNYRCFCHVDHELSTDGKSCIQPKKFIAFNHFGYTRAIKWREDMQQYIDVLNPLYAVEDEFARMDVDAEEGVSYQMRSSHFNSGDLLRVDLYSGKTVSFQMEWRAEGIALDWASKNLYYFDDYCKDNTLLKVLNTKNPTYNKILGRGKQLYKNAGIVVHPNRGYVYYLETRTILRRIHTDGSNSTLLLEKSKEIESFAIDYIEDKLFWVLSEEDHGNRATMYYSNLDGTNTIKVENAYFGQPVQMMIQGNWIYILDMFAESVGRIPKKGGEFQQLLISFYIYDLRDTSNQTTRSDHPCSGSANICEKFCFAVPLTESNDGLKRVCGCPYREKLADDGRSCIDNSKEEPPLPPACN